MSFHVKANCKHLVNDVKCSLENKDLKRKLFGLIKPTCVLHNNKLTCKYQGLKYARD